MCFILLPKHSKSRAGAYDLSELTFSKEQVVIEGDNIGICIISFNFSGNLMTTSKYDLFRSHSSPYLFLETCQLKLLLGFTFLHFVS